MKKKKLFFHVLIIISACILTQCKPSYKKGKEPKFNLYYSFCYKDSTADTINKYKVYVVFNGHIHGTAPVELTEKGNSVMKCPLYDSTNYASVEVRQIQFKPHWYSRHPAEALLKIRMTIYATDMAGNKVASENYEDLLKDFGSPYIVHYESPSGDCKIDLRNTNTIYLKLIKNSQGCPVLDITWPPII